jgi:transcriptional regulator with XRE-family HTH domain
MRMLKSLVGDDAALHAMLTDERSNAAVARQIHELRTAQGLTQKQLAESIGTQQPVIARLEDADYEGHSLAMLHRIGAALGCTVAVLFVPRSPAANRSATDCAKRSPARQARKGSRR